MTPNSPATRNPHVTIVIPVYNAARYIEETLDSVFAQTYPDIDVICVDDQSKDNSVQIIEQYRATRALNSKLELITLPTNSGPSVARNKAIEKAQGDYILPLDADDKIDPTYIEKAVQCFINNPELAVVYCEAATFGYKNAPYYLPPYHPEKIVVNNMVFATALFKKSDWLRYKGYKENMREGLEDWDLWLCFVEDDRKFYRIPETLFFYRQSAETRSHSARKNLPLLKKKIRKNHPQLYNLRTYITNPYLRKDLLKSIRKWCIQIKLQKDKKIIRLFGIYFLYQVQD